MSTDTQRIAAKRAEAERSGVIGSRAALADSPQEPGHCNGCGRTWTTRPWVHAPGCEAAAVADSPLHEQDIVDAVGPSA